MAARLNTNPVSASFRWMNSGDDYFETLLGAISEARFAVRLEMYIFSEFPVAELVRDALIEARSRGAEIKVLLDGWGSLFLEDRFWNSLRDCGGHVRWFNPLSLKRYGIRNHRKLLVCDDFRALVGGFNIAPEWQGDGRTGGWRDLGLEVRGPIVCDLATSFETLFSMADFRHKRFVRLRKAMLRKSVPIGNGQLLLSGPGRGQNHFSDAILKDLATANTVSIIAAYFIPSRPIRRALTRYARNGCNIQVILAGESDVPLSQLASRRFYEALLRAGVEIYEYQPQILHAKLLVIDDVVYVGSANLDRRSIYINYELMLRISDHKLAEEARSFFLHDVALSRKIEAAAWRKSRTFWAKLLERWAFFVLARFDPLIARRQLRNLR